MRYAITFTAWLAMMGHVVSLTGCTHATTVESEGPRPQVGASSAALNCPPGYYSPEGKTCVWESPTDPEPCHADGGVADAGRPPKCPYGGSYPYCLEPYKP